MIYDLAIIGGGPAGLTAAIYAKRALLKTIIFEKHSLGGKLNKTKEIENYPGFVSINGNELAELFSQQVKKYQVKILETEVVWLEKKGEQGYFLLRTNQDEDYFSYSVIIASGSIEKQLCVPGEEKFANLGVSYCVICDGFLFKEKEVVIVGGGYSAFEASLYMSKLASKVYLVHHSEKFSVDQEIINRTKNLPNVEFLINWKVKEVLGSQRVEQIVLNNVFDNKEFILNASALFPCIGLRPFVGFLAHLEVLDDGKYVKVDNNGKTTIEGLFSAGDVARSHNKKIRQIVTAIAEGAIASQNAIEYLGKKKVPNS